MLHPSRPHHPQQQQQHRQRLLSKQKARERQSTLARVLLPNLQPRQLQLQRRTPSSRASLYTCRRITRTRARSGLARASKRPRPSGSTTSLISKDLGTHGFCNVPSRYREPVDCACLVCVDRQRSASEVTRPPARCRSATKLCPSQCASNMVSNVAMYTIYCPSFNASSRADRLQMHLTVLASISTYSWSHLKHSMAEATDCP